MLASNAVKKSRISDFYRGDSVVYKLTIKNDDGSPVDLQGQVIWFSMKKKASSFPELQLRYDLPDTNSTYEQGIAYLYLPYDKTNKLTKGVYEYDIQLVLTVGSETMIKTLQKNTVMVLEDVTTKES